MKKYGMFKSGCYVFGANTLRTNYFSAGHVVAIHHEDDKGFIIFHDTANPRWLYRAHSSYIKTDIPQGTKHYFTFFGKRQLLSKYT